MGIQQTAFRPATALGDFQDKVLVVADGNITVRIEEERQRVAVAHPRSWIWQTVAAVSLAIAAVSSVVTAAAIVSLRGEIASRFDAQNLQLQDHIDNAFADAKSRSMDASQTMLLKTDDLGRKLDLIPGRIDASAREVAISVSDSMTAFQRALRGTAPPPTRPSPLLIRRKREG